MDQFKRTAKSGGFSCTLWRGELMCLLGMNVEQCEPDFVGFAIERRAPGESDFQPLPNRIAFEYPAGSPQPTGRRWFPSTEAPFQKFRWVDFPRDVKAGTYAYRVTRMHMPKDNQLKSGESLELDISLDPITYPGFLEVGFTRGYASSQAFVDKFQGTPNFTKLGPLIIPSEADDGLKFKRLTTPPGLYEWMGFEGYQLIMSVLKEAASDSTISVDAMCYDLNEPEIVDLLKSLKKRLRIIIDDSITTKKSGELSGHGETTSAESQAAKILIASTGKKNVVRTHCNGLQHNKVFILKRNGKAFKVLGGSTNHSFRGLFIQSNNVLVFSDPGIAGLFADYFELLFTNATGYAKEELSKKWHVFREDGRPPIHVCLSPHSDPKLSLNPIGGAIEQASSCVLYNIAFLNQAKTGALREAVDRLAGKPVFSYGVSNLATGLEVLKPDGSVAVVDFAYLNEKTPEPFKKEWSGGSGIHMHHKFVVTDFNLPTAKVFTGSCNMAVSGEKGNGDHLILIEDQRVATAYAIEALRVFDHLHFRSTLKNAKAKPETITLKKPRKISKKPAWFESYYEPKNTQKIRDRITFSS